MTKEQAQQEFHKLMDTPKGDSLTIGERSKLLASSSYPETDIYFWDYIWQKITPQEFESKCVKYIQLSDTKLFQILK